MLLIDLRNERPAAELSEQERLSALASRTQKLLECANPLVAKRFCHEGGFGLSLDHELLRLEPDLPSVFPSAPRR